MTFATRIGSWFGQLVTGTNSALTGFSAVFDFIKSFINDIINVFKYTLQANEMANHFIATLPDWLRPYAIITLSVLVLYIITGRSAGAHGRGK